MLLSRSAALSHTLRTINLSSKSPQTIIRRAVSTLKENPHIYIHPTPTPTTHKPRP
ncbi:cf940f3f-3058-4193-8e21-cbeb7fd910f6 [Sclerotinia trifoliorum]|uniref:Cf940f3f-3058-4193-8e21-cbeb7fd910f6 n=1 Tax=Sclerotinia trifoliorum TaxID=28548 RepID=A0A8H2VPU9_9HELO|nr:cf940f3f-3058-4193-8e21-cbeb7fd910f6 [Sclerotinia trifoliorum]